MHKLLTLRGLSLFFKILLVSDTGDSAVYILATVHFQYPKLGFFFDMEYYVSTCLPCQESKIPKCFVWLIQKGHTHMDPAALTNTNHSPLD